MSGRFVRAASSVMQSDDVLDAKIASGPTTLSSAVYAAVGIYALIFLPNGRLFPELGPSTLVTSTFVNQNHYVTFAGIGLVACVGGILRLYRHALSEAGHLWRLKIAALVNTTGSQAALPLAFAAVIMTGVLLTGSPLRRCWSCCVSRWRTWTAILTRLAPGTNGPWPHQKTPRPFV